MQLILLPWLLLLITINFLDLLYSSAVYGALDCNNEPENGASAITVGTSGNEQFKTLQAAIDFIPLNNDKWSKIAISPGIYMEKVNIPKEKSCIFLQGSGRNVTTIVFNAHEETDTSPSFSSNADNFLAKDITFKNSYNHALDLKDDIIKQAVSVGVFGDKSAFYECGFVGLQDTLWDEKGRHYFYNCYIEGAIDFIFGDGQSFYEDCSLNATAGLLGKSVEDGYITAQGRGSSSETTGFVFQGGRVFGSGKNFLGRAYGAYSRVIFIETRFDDVIAPPGWDAWLSHAPVNESNLVYAEINCEGPGSDTSKRVPWMKKLNQEEINSFSRSSFIDQDGWISKLPSSQLLAYSGYVPFDSLPLDEPSASQTTSSNNLHLLLSMVTILICFCYYY